MPDPDGSWRTSRSQSLPSRASLISHREGNIVWRRRVCMDKTRSMLPTTMPTTAITGANASQRLIQVQAAIAKSAKLARRAPDTITLIAISKTYGPDAITPLIGAGQGDFGENRVQEAQEKWPALIAAYPNLRLHLVGQLQSNKAGDAVALFDAIHSVDRPSLAQALAKAMTAQGKRPDCFVQVNIGDEAQKGGCALADLAALLDECRVLDLPITGLMCVPPADAEAVPYFALLAQLADRHGLPALSMGMSGDYESAVQLGATHVRVGSALFGARS
jgi:PLP dependent protein